MGGRSRPSSSTWPAASCTPSTWWRTQTSSSACARSSRPDRGKPQHSNPRHVTRGRGWCVFRSESAQNPSKRNDHGSPKETFMLQGGELYPFPVTPSQFVHRGLLDAGDKLGLARLFASLATLKPRTVAQVSVEEWLERNIRRPRLRLLMAALARTFVYTSALDLVSAEVFVDKLRRTLRHPVHYIDGGWQTL